jgi:hypothetical protein
MKVKTWTLQEVETIVSDLKTTRLSLRQISKNRHKEFNRGVSGTFNKVIEINKFVNKGLTANEIIELPFVEKSRRTTSGLLRLYTKKEINIMKSNIATGEPITYIADRLAIEFDRPVVGLRCKLYNLKSQVKKIDDWKGPTKIEVVKEKLNFEPDTIQQPADVGVEVPHGMTFEGKPKRITLHSDHFRIYF